MNGGLMFASLVLTMLGVLGWFMIQTLPQRHETFLLRASVCCFLAAVTCQFLAAFVVSP